MTQNAAGICWPRGGTVGRMTVDSTRIRGAFRATSGDDALVCCNLVAAGKYRNGASRSWCRTHQQYWGVKADLAALCATKRAHCARHAEPMSYLLDPVVIDMRNWQHVVITHCNGLFNATATAAAGIAVHYASQPALAFACEPGLFHGPDIVQLHLTPPAMQAWQMAARSGLRHGCIACARCGHPHLDLGDFAQKEHKRHYCGNCGSDSTHSPAPLVSHPLSAVFDFYQERLRVVHSNVHHATVL